MALTRWLVGTIYSCNWFMMAKTEAGAEANAIWYTFIQMAKLNQFQGT